ncbi:MAG: tryptophan 7-halogenase [Gammaproteobacteria bacterium]|nr:tryptophan 7-halogenase [Gammaproteobacteria bacterium]
MQRTENSHKCDVLVIGGGPAGSTISTKLAQMGRDVVMVEKEQHPRFHIGESLLPMNMPIFEELGVLDQVEEIGIRKYGAEFNDENYQNQATYYFENALDSSFPFAYEVKREDLDTILFRNAAEKGVKTFEKTRVTSVHFNDDHSSVVECVDGDGNAKKWQARFIVDASGRSTFLARKFNTKKRSKEHNSAAIFAHFDHVVRREGRDEGNISLAWFEHGWFWMIPFKDGSMSVGAVCWPHYLNSRKTDIEQFLWDTIALCPPVANRMKEAKLTTPVTATGNFTYAASHMAGNGYLMVGDAFAFLDPIFSSGVLVGMAGGLKGATVVNAILDDPEKAKQLIQNHDKEMRGALKTFSWFIYRITQPAMRYLFMVRAERRVKRERGVTSLLAGDLFRELPVGRHLLIFKFFYYALFMLDFRKNWRSLRKRKFDLRGKPTTAKEANFKL